MDSENNFKVMIAEDEHRIRENLAGKIPKINPNFEISGTAANGRIALSLINKKPPDLLITDIKMPVMDGLQLIEELYHTHPDLPVIILSGYDDFEYAKQAIHLGVKDYILKPTSKIELSSVLSRIEIILNKNRKLLLNKEYVYNSSASANELCSKITEYLRTNFTDNISISDIADTFRINPTYMSRVFKQNTGRTPSRFLTELRINHAKKLLSEFSQLDVKEISLQIGFEDQGYFSRFFKKETGMSPGEFRKQS